MNLLTVGEFKSKFSSVLETVIAGKQVGITYGKKKEPVAVLIPFKKYKAKKRKLGIWEGKAIVKFSKDFKFKSVEEFLAS